MRRFSLRLAIAVIAFIVGVTTAAIFGVPLSPRARTSYHFHDGPSPSFQMRARSRSCPHSAPVPQVLGELPPLPDAPEAPVPPTAGPKTSKTVRTLVRRPDGTLQVIESQIEQSDTRQF